MLELLLMTRFAAGPPLHRVKQLSNPNRNRQSPQLPQPCMTLLVGLFPDPRSVSPLPDRSQHSPSNAENPRFALIHLPKAQMRFAHNRTTFPMISIPAYTSD